MKQVAEIVRKIGVDAPDERVARDIAVLSECDLAQEEVADSVRAELLDEGDGVDDVADRLRHLCTVDDEPAMPVDFFRQVKPERHEHTAPDDRVKAHDFLTDEMHVRRPIFMEHFLVVEVADRREVVRECVEPDVDDVLRVERHGDAPVERGARDAQILQSLLDEGDHLVAARDGLDEVGMLVDVGEQTIRILAHAEEVRLLGDLLHGAVAVGAAAVLVELQLRPVALARRAVEPSVRTLVNVALIVDALEDVLHELIVARLGRTDEVVVGDAEQPPQLLKARNNAVDVLDGRDALLLRRLLDLLPMFIRAGQKEHIEAREPLVARNGIRNRRAVGVTDMQLRTRVVDGGGDVKWSLFAHKSCLVSI